MFENKVLRKIFGAEKGTKLQEIGESYVMGATVFALRDGGSSGDAGRDDFTLHSDLKTAVHLPNSTGILIHSKKRVENICETGILP